MGANRGWMAAAVIGGALWGLAGTRSDKPRPEWIAPPEAAARVNPLPADDANRAAGKALYARWCSSCHGETGRGDGAVGKIISVPPADLIQFAHPDYQSDGALFWKVTTGRGPMQSYEKVITEQERWQLVHYLRVLATAPVQEPKAGGKEKKKKKA